MFKKKSKEKLFAYIKLDQEESLIQIGWLPRLGTKVAKIRE